MTSWTQAVCDEDWEKLNPGRVVHRMVEEFREDEICCYCGQETRSGIYASVDPFTVPYPRVEIPNEEESVSFIAIAKGEDPPWGNDRTCPECGATDLPLLDSKPPMLTYISHCGKSWLRGPIKMPEERAETDE